MPASVQIQKSAAREATVIAPLSPAIVTPSTQSIRKKFETTQNYAAFINEAMQQTTGGGRFFAQLAYHRCAQVITISPKLDVEPIGPVLLSDAAERRITDLKNRCSGVKDYFPDELTFMRALLTSFGKTASSVVFERGLIAQSPPDMVGADLTQAIASKDPYVISTIIEVNLPYLGPSLDSAFRDSSNDTLLSLAAASVICELVGSCTNSDNLSALCLAGGNCKYADYREYLRASIEPGRLTLFDKTRAQLLSLAQGQKMPEQ